MQMLDYVTHIISASSFWAEICKVPMKNVSLSRTVQEMTETWWKLSLNVDINHSVHKKVLDVATVEHAKRYSNVEECHEISKAAADEFSDDLLIYVSISDGIVENSEDDNSTVIAPKTPLPPQSVIIASLNEWDSTANSSQVNCAKYQLRRARYTFMSAKRNKMKIATRQMLISKLVHNRSESHTVSDTGNDED